ncbi:MAG: PD40 domain-containing protein [Chloroflexi bacterium]|nr:PD40 domain-containing protein [Chloroflexota bacterium]
MKQLKGLILLAILFTAIVVPTVFADAPTGTGPQDPFYATGQWQTVAPNATGWYYFDYPGDRSKVEVDLDANGNRNVQLLILTPEQARAYVQDPTTKPVGNGTIPGANTQASNHDLVWLGGFNFGGRFFAVVVNRDASPVPVRVTISGSNVLFAPTPTPTVNPLLLLPNPFATRVPTGTIQGKLVFQDASGGNIFTVNGDGSQLTRVTYGLDPNWSPDGKQIIFSRWNQPAGLFLVNVGDPLQGADGTNEQALFGSEKLISPQWSSDGTKIAFARQWGGSTDDTQFCFRGACFTFAANPHWKIGVVNASGSNLLQPPCSNYCFSPTWAGDNRTLAYADATFGILTTDTTPNSGPASNLFTQNPAVQSTVYSPDGSKIAFMVRQADHWEINWINADGANVTAVTFADPLSFQVVNNVAPAWSPDGKQILFLSDRNGKWEFFVVNLDGTGLTQVLKNVTDANPIRYNFSNERVVDWTR